MSNADSGDIREGELKEEESRYDNLAHFGGIAVVLGLIIEVVLTASFPRARHFLRNGAQCLQTHSSP